MAKESDSEPQHGELSCEQTLPVLNKFGPYQRRLLLLLILPLIGDSYSSFAVVITFSVPKHRCQVPGLANDTFSIQNDAHRMMVNRSVPMTSIDGDVSYAKCDVYMDRDEQHANRTMYDDTEPCDSWVYDDTDFEKTIATQFDLVCEKKGFRANYNMMYLLGILLGSFMCGFICDRLVCRSLLLFDLDGGPRPLPPPVLRSRKHDPDGVSVTFGRRKVFIIFNIPSAAVVVAMAFPVVPQMLLFYRFLDAVISANKYMALYVLCLEFVGPERRTLTGSLMTVLYSAGVLLVGILSYVFRDWRWLQAFNGVPFIPCLVYWWLLDESPRWLLTKGRVQEARKVILKVMKVNQIPVSADSPLGGDSSRMDNVPKRNTAAADISDTADLQTEATGMMADTDNEGGVEAHNNATIWMDKQDKDGIARENSVQIEKKADIPQESALKLFKYPNLIARTSIIVFNWVTISTTYYAISLNVANLTGNIRTNFLLSGLVELVGYSTAWLFLDRLGRKCTHCAAMFLSGTSCLATIFSVLYGGSDLQWVTILLVMVGKLGISAAFNTIFLMSAELFPTVIRNRGMGCSSTVARVATIVSPYIVDMSLHIEGSMGRALPLVIFGALALAAGLLALCLPETLHRKLPDTILEAATFTRKYVPAEAPRGPDIQVTGIEIESKRRATVLISVSTPYFEGRIWAIALENPMCSLLIGNHIKTEDGAQLRVSTDLSEGVSAAVQTRSATRAQVKELQPNLTLFPQGMALDMQKKDVRLLQEEDRSLESVRRCLTRHARPDTVAVYERSDGLLYHRYTKGGNRCHKTSSRSYPNCLQSTTQHAIAQYWEEDRN
ncbi:hypothetical protein ACOMHN_043120 [Nucella lapillus]